MEYETVELKEKKVIGIASRTNNHSPEMMNIIGGLWNKFYQGGVYNEIPNKCTQTSLGIYSEYDGNQDDDYTVTVATEVSSIERIPADCVPLVIPAGKYAKFSVKTSMQKGFEDVGTLWLQIWKTDLDRTFIADFEEYFAPESDGSEIVNIYIGLK